MDCATEAEFRQLTGGVLTGMVRPEERRELFQVMKQFREGTSTFQHIRYAVKTRIGRLRYVDALDYLGGGSLRKAAPLYFQCAGG